MKIRLGRVYRFFASHRLHSSFLTPEENRSAYGKCNSPRGHGHTYKVTVIVEGEPDPRTGMIMDLEELDRIVTTTLERYHYRMLEELPEFQELPSTGERIVLLLYQRLFEALAREKSHLYALELEETRNNHFSIRT